MKNTKISVKKIAEMSGVSVATVSRVINNNGRFSKETGQKIRRIIEEYNYQPNQMARGLRINKTQVVGVMVPDITNEFFARTILAIQKELMKYGYSVLVCNTDEDAEVEKYHQSVLKAHLVSGIIYISGSNFFDDVLLSIPTVYIDRMPNDTFNENLVLIESDNISGGKLATQKLLDCGCKRVAFVRLNKEVSSHEDRYQGYLEALRVNGTNYYEELCGVVKSISPEEGYKITKKLLTDNKNVDGIFFTSDLLAVGALKYIQEIGIRVPHNIKIVSYDDISVCSIVTPRLTTIHQDIEIIGAMAAKALINQFEGNPIDNRHIKVPVSLIEREST